MIMFYVTQLLPNKNATESYKLHWYVDIQQVYHTHAFNVASSLKISCYSDIAKCHWSM